METTVKTVSITLAAVSIVVMWAWRVFDWVWVRPRMLERRLRSQGLAGTSYRLFYGDLKDISSMRKRALSTPISLSSDIRPRVIPFVHQAVHRYGKNSFIWMGPVPKATIMDPDLIREILIKFNQFQKPSPNPLSKLLVSGLPRHEGEKWAKHRKIVNPAFHLEKLKLMVPAFCSSCNHIVYKWEKLVSVEGTCELDVVPYLDELTADVISRTAFGSNYEEGKMIFELQREQAGLALQSVQSIYIPGWRFLPTKMNNRMKQIEKQVQGLLSGVINRKVEAMKAGKSTSNDLLGILLESNYNKSNRSCKTIELSIKEVIEECKVFYLAGQETTSSLLVWTLVMLCVHPSWQAKAREEVLHVFGKSTPDLGGLGHLKVVTMILHEVLRLYPPVSILTRTIHKDTTLGKMHLPAGAQLSLPTILVHYDKEMWGNDATQFNPERFSEGVSKATKQPQSFFPFGGGPRICVGQNFAMIEAKIALSMILQRFSFLLSPSYMHAPFALISLRPQHGAPLILRKL